MGDMFKKPKSFGPSREQREMEQRQLEQQREQESELAERKAMRKRRLAGRSSLLSGAETGTAPSGLSNTLG